MKQYLKSNITPGSYLFIYSLKDSGKTVQHVAICTGIDNGCPRIIHATRGNHYKVVHGHLKDAFDNEPCGAIVFTPDDSYFRNQLCIIAEKSNQLIPYSLKRSQAMHSFSYKAKNLETALSRCKKNFYNDKGYTPFKFYARERFQPTFKVSGKGMHCSQFAVYATHMALLNKALSSQPNLKKQIQTLPRDANWVSNRHGNTNFINSLSRRQCWMTHNNFPNNHRFDIKSTPVLPLLPRVSTDLKYLGDTIESLPLQAKDTSPAILLKCLIDNDGGIGGMLYILDIDPEAKDSDYAIIPCTRQSAQFTLVNANDEGTPLSASDSLDSDPYYPELITQLLSPAYLSDDDSEPAPSNKRLDHPDSDDDGDQAATSHFFSRDRNTEHRDPQKNTRLRLR